MKVAYNRLIRETHKSAEAKKLGKLRVFANFSPFLPGNTAPPAKIPSPQTLSHDFLTFAHPPPPRRDRLLKPAETSRFCGLFGLLPPILLSLYIGAATFNCVRAKV